MGLSVIGEMNTGFSTSCRSVLNYPLAVQLSLCSTHVQLWWLFYANKVILCRFYRDRKKAKWAWRRLCSCVNWLYMVLGGCDYQTTESSLGELVYLATALVELLSLLTAFQCDIFWFGKNHFVNATDHVNEIKRSTSVISIQSGKELINEKWIY